MKDMEVKVYKGIFVFSFILETRNLRCFLSICCAILKKYLDLIL
jgi:hypothetical protein